MRARAAPPRGGGLLNGHYHDAHKHAGKKGAGHSRYSVLKVAAVLAVSLWLLVLYRHTHPSPRGRRSAWSVSYLLGLESSPSSSGDLARGSASPLAVGAKEQERKSSRHTRKKKKKSSEGGCSESPLLQKEAFPIYGCDEMEVRANERQ